MSSDESSLLPGEKVPSKRADEGTLQRSILLEESLLLQCAATMGVAMTPVLELRGAIPFGLALIAALKGQEAADAVEKQIVIR